MMINALGIQFQDYIFNSYDPGTQQKLREAMKIIEDPKLPLLERAIYEDFIYKHAHIDVPMPAVDKKERKRLARMKRREAKKAKIVKTANLMEELYPTQPPMEEKKFVVTQVGDESPVVTPIIEEEFTPLEQSFVGKDNDIHPLTEVIDPDIDVYKKEKRTKGTDGKTTVEVRYLLRRDAVRKIAEAAGLKSSKVVVFAPSIDNNYLTAFDITVTDPLGNTTTMLGEASNENTRGISKMYKALTAERRGYVRAILAHLGLKGIYGEDEFIEEDDIDVEEDKMPTKEEFEKIAPLVNRILNAESKTALQEIGEEIKGEVESLSEKQMNYLRELYKKNLNKFEAL